MAWCRCKQKGRQCGAVCGIFSQPRILSWKNVRQGSTESTARSAPIRSGLQGHLLLPLLHVHLHAILILLPYAAGKAAAVVLAVQVEFSRSMLSAIYTVGDDV